MKFKSLLIVSLVLILTVVLSACGSSETASNGGDVSISGSTSVLPLAQELAYGFEEVNADIRVNVNGGGSSQGVKDASTGVSDIGNASRNLKDSEKELNLQEYIIAYDGIAVVVHPSNPVQNLSQEEVLSIYKGEITNWNELGGNDQEIQVVSREDGSGTRGAFEEIVGLESDNGSLLTTDALIFNGNGGVKAAVASKDNAIGYVSLAYLDDSIKTLTINEVAPTVENIKSDAYPIARPFLMLTGKATSPQTDAFLEFVLSDEGQLIVSEKYIPVN